MSSFLPLLQRGDVVIAAFPFTDLSANKRRPALVLAVTTTSADVILAFISSVFPTTISPYELPFTPTEADFPQTGLKVPSILRLDKLATIDRRLITRRIGKLTQQRLQAVDDRLLRVLGIDIKRYQQEERRQLARLMHNQGIDALVRTLPQTQG